MRLLRWDPDPAAAAAAKAAVLISKVLRLLLGEEVVGLSPDLSVEGVADDSAARAASAAAAALSMPPRHPSFVPLFCREFCTSTKPK